MKTTSVLEAQILVEVEKLKLLPDGSEEKQRAIESICNMFDSVEESHSNFLKNVTGFATVGVSAIGLGLNFIYKWVWTGRGFEFEKTGTFVTKTLRDVFTSKILSK